MSTTSTSLPPTRDMYLGYFLDFHYNKKELDEFYEKRYNDLNSKRIDHFEIYEVVNNKYYKGEILFASPLPPGEARSFIRNMITEEPKIGVGYYTKIGYGIFNNEEKYKIVYSYEGVMNKTKSAAKITHT